MNSYLQKHISLLKHPVTRFELIIASVIVLPLVIATMASAATTISTNISTEGTLSVTGTSTLATTTVNGNFSVTGTTNGIKVYRALLTQSGTNPPVATVLENTLGGTPVWSRVAAGLYKLTLAGAFTVNKIYSPVLSLLNSQGLSLSVRTFQNPVNDAPNSVEIISRESGSASTVELEIINDNDNLYDVVPFEILVYP